MPELPEVETIRLGLQRYVVGKTIDDVEIRLAKIVSGNPKDIIGAKVIDVRRFGKGLVIDLDNDYSIAIHIKLTGQLIYQDSDISKLIHLSPKTGGTLPNKWTHVIFKLKSQKSKVNPFDKLRVDAERSRSIKSTSQNSKVGNPCLYYNDVRQFGWIKIIKTSEASNLPFFRDLGSEPLSNLTMKQFNNIVCSSASAIKFLIMDQKKMSGVGNIYANDALFDSQIDPRRKAKELSEDEIKKLYDSILKVLKKGLENGGASELSFVNVLGQEGGYQNHFLVYGREGEKCKRCGSEIKKIRLGGRGTYFCEKCQI